MANDDPRGSRARAEDRFRKAQRTTDEAKAVSDSELDASRKKTARLKAERLAKEAGEAKSALDKKPHGKKLRGR